MFTLLAIQSFGVDGSTWGGCIGPMFLRVWGFFSRNRGHFELLKIGMMEIISPILRYCNLNVLCYLGSCLCFQ